MTSAPAPRTPAPRTPARTVVAVVAALLVALLSACGTTSTSGNGLVPSDGGSNDGSNDGPNDGSTGGTGEATVPAPTGSGQRILPLRGNISEIVFGLGLGGDVVGRDESATFPEAAHLPVVTRGHDISAEAVLSLRPTLVLAQDDDGPPEAIEHIRNAGVDVQIITTPTTVDAISPRIRRIAAILGREARGDELAARTDREMAEVQRSVPRTDAPPKVAFLYMRGQAGVYLIGGRGSGADSMITAAGGIDAGTAMGLDRAFTPITSEALAQAAPDIILMTSTGLESVGGIDGLVGIPGIAQTPAGRDRRIVTQEDGLLYSFGERTPEALRALIADLYPDGDDTGSG